MPCPAITTIFGMTCSCFNFIWRHFHVQEDSGNYQDDPFTSEEDDDSEEEEFMDQTMERVDREECYMNRDDSSVETPDDESHDEGDVSISDEKSDGKKGKVHQEDVDS
eukprot:4698896-Ditylum_brightwellii.AAC.1